MISRLSIVFCKGRVASSRKKKRLLFSWIFCTQKDCCMRLYYNFFSSRKTAANNQAFEFIKNSLPISLFALLLKVIERFSVAFKAFLIDIFMFFLAGIWTRSCFNWWRKEIVGFWKYHHSWRCSPDKRRRKIIEKNSP